MRVIAPPPAQGIFGFISAGSRGSPEKIKFRTLDAPKHIPEAVEKLERLRYLQPALPPDIAAIAEDTYDMFENALISTTSIKGATLKMLTTNKQQIQVSDPRIKRGVLGGAGKFLGGGRDEFD